MKISPKFYSLGVALFIAVSGIILISSCASTSGISDLDPYYNGAKQIEQGVRQIQNGY